MGDLVQLFPRPDAPVQPLPIAEPSTLFGDCAADNFVPISDLSRPWDGPKRRHFGMREPTGEALFNVPRPEDREAQDRIKRAAREARNAFDRAHVDPSLDRCLASRITQLAGIASMLADEARALGHLRQAATLRDMASYGETCAAEILIPHTPESA